MGDCPNVEMRELLPGRVAELLSTGEARRVDAHVATCEMCAFEVTVLKAARLTLQRAPQVDVQRISLAVAAVTRSAPARRVTRTSAWTGWRAAASIALLVVGATSVAVWQRAEPAARDSLATMGQYVAPPAVVVAPNTPAVPARGSASQVAGLSVAGGLSDLSDTQLESLLGEIGTLDASNVAEPEDVIPTISGAESIQ